MFLGELLPVSLAFTSSRSAFRARSIVASLSDPFCAHRDVLPVSILREACCRGRLLTGSARKIVAADSIVTINVDKTLVSPKR